MRVCYNNISMNKQFKTAILSVLVALLGTGSLLFFTKLIGQQSQQEILPYFIYQLITLGISGVVIAVMYFSKGRNLNYLRVGSLRVKARPIKPLGIKEGESWLSVGITFTVIITVVTGIFLFFGYGGQLAKLIGTVIS